MSHLRTVVLMICQAALAYASWGRPETCCKMPRTTLQITSISTSTQLPNAAFASLNAGRRVGLAVAFNHQHSSRSEATKLPMMTSC